MREKMILASLWIQHHDLPVSSRVRTLNFGSTLFTFTNMDESASGGFCHRITVELELINLEDIALPDLPPKAIKYIEIVNGGYYHLCRGPWWHKADEDIQVRYTSLKRESEAQGNVTRGTDLSNYKTRAARQSARSKSPFKPDNNKQESGTKKGILIQIAL